MTKLLCTICALALLFSVPAYADTGLEWDGVGSTRSMLLWDLGADPVFPMYPATYIFRVLPHAKTGVEFPNGYYTTFFWGNNGTFIWDGGNAGSYYGMHPYPTPAPDGEGEWEISVRSDDFVTGTKVDWDRWHTQAIRVWRDSASITQHEFYYDLPDTGKVITHEVNDAGWAATMPPSPAIVVGQAPDNGSGASWGGYPGWEEFHGVIRGMQFYTTNLSVADILLEIATPMGTTAGANNIWYLNINPTPTDTADDSGQGNDPTWEGAAPALYTDQGTVALTVSGVALSGVN